MSEISITIPGGTTKRLLTAGKYCPSDILVTAEGSSSRLPDGYTELEYIQSSGTQYIDTGFAPNQNTRVVCDVIFAITTTAYWLFGSRTTNTKNTYNFLTWESKYRSDYNTSTDELISTIPSGRFVVDKNGNVTSFDGTVMKTTTAGTFQCDYNLFLFANNNAGTVQGPCTATLYSCQIYDNGNLIRDFVPCVNDSDEVGLYDLVGKQFYGNAGSGAFSQPGTLPTLTNPATAENIEAGFEAIDGTGTMIVGSLVKGFTKFERVITNKATTNLATLDANCVYIASMWRPSTNYYALCLVENNTITWEQHGASATQFKIVSGVLQSTSSISYSTVWKISK